jgi:hypothetical protein
MKMLVYLILNYIDFSENLNLANKILEVLAQNIVLEEDHYIYKYDFV